MTARYYEELFKDYEVGHLPEHFRVISGKHGLAWAECDQRILKSKNDSRDYKLIRLNNAMEVMLVSDPTCDKAASNLCVRTGSVNDPDDIPGLSHLLEHMLFMGSEKYPGEDEWDNYLSRKGGDSNATTGKEYTNFFFSVQPSGLPGALDRLAGILTAPLFKAATIEREVKAVQSEFERHQEADGQRFDAVHRLLSKRGHPYAKFTCGNKETLDAIPMAKGINMRSRLVEHYKHHYPASLMRMAIISNHSLNTMTQIVAGLFTDIPTVPHTPPFRCLEGDQAGPEWQQHFLYLESRKEGEALKLRFPMEDQSPYWRHAPLYFLSLVIGDEVEGSLLAYLKKRDWAHALVAGGDADVLTGYSSFEISVDLTSAGKACYRDVIIAIFSYIKLLTKHAANLQAKFEEYARLDDLSFRFQEPGDPESVVLDLATGMHGCSPAGDIMVSDTLVKAIWDERVVTKALSQMSPQTMSVHLASESGWQGVTLDKKERVFGVNFATRPLGKLVEECRHAPALSSLKIPTSNPFVPARTRELTLLGPKDEHVDAIVVKEGPGYRLWHSEDVRFRVPKSSCFVAIRNSMAAKTARNEILARLFTDVVEEEINPLTYAASEAGLAFGFAQTSTGLEMQFAGYSETLPVLADHVFKAVAELSPEESTFKRLKERLSKSYRNLLNHHKASQQALSLFHQTCMAKYYTTQERLAVLEDISLEELLSFGAGLIHRSYVEIFLHGHSKPEDVMDIHNRFMSHNTPRPAANPPRAQNYLLPPAFDRVVRDLNSDERQLQSCCVNVYAVGSVENRRHIVTLALLQSVLEQPFFDELRTKKQLGYVARLQQATEGGSSYLLTHVEGNHPAEFLNAEMEKFLLAAPDLVEGLSAEAFEDFKESLSLLFLENFKEMDEEACYLWSGIDDTRLGFDLYVKDAAMVKTLHKEELLDMLRQSISSEGAQRSKLSIRVGSQRLMPDYHAEPLGQVLRDQACTSAMMSRFQELIKEAPTVEELLKALSLDSATSQGHAIIEAAGELLRGKPTKGDLRVEDIPSLHKILEVGHPPRAYETN